MKLRHATIFQEILSCPEYNFIEIGTIKSPVNVDKGNVYKTNAYRLDQYF